MSQPVHPGIYEWIREKDKNRLLLQLRKAEGVLGDFGKITITYQGGKAVKVEINKVENIE